MSSNHPPPDVLNAQIVTTTERLFDLTPHEWQTGIINDLVQSHRFNNKSNMLIVRPTGGGKSLVYQVAGYLMKGITLFISPLLALASDQTRKFGKVTTTQPDFVSLHLDDMELSSIKEVANDLSTFNDPASSQCSVSVILFTSPQLLVGSKGEPIIKVLLDNEKSTLHMVVMDEVHLASQFGSTFRTEFKHLKQKLYSRLPGCCSINMFMTGTCTLEIMQNFESLFGIKIDFTYWPNHEQMRHRSVCIKSRYTGTPMNEIKKVLNATMKGPSASRSTKILMYSNMREKTIEVGKKVEEYLETDDETFLIDVLTIHGRQTRTQKASYLDLFVSDQTTLAHDVRILCATSGVANAGIDSKNVRCAIRIEFPPSIQDICQEKGRVGRIQAATPDDFAYLICFNIDSFVLLLRRTLNPDEKMTNSFRSMMISDHIKVAQLFTSIHSCFNHVFEHSLSNPFLRNEVLPVTQQRCNHCPGCTGELERLYRVVVLRGAQDILFAAYTTTSKYKIGDLAQFISNQENVDRCLFARNHASVPKKDIKLFLFQLIAWEILIPQYIMELKSVVFVPAKITEPAMFICIYLVIQRFVFRV